MKFEYYLDAELALLQANRNKADNLRLGSQPRQSISSDVSNKSLKYMITSMFPEDTILRGLLRVPRRGGKRN